MCDKNFFLGVINPSCFDFNVSVFFVVMVFLHVTVSSILIIVFFFFKVFRSQTILNARIFLRSSSVFLMFLVFLLSEFLL